VTSWRWPALAAWAALGLLGAVERSAPAGPLDRQGLAAFAPGIEVEVGRRLVLHGRINLDRGPVDEAFGLEVLASLPEGRLHEALIRLDAGEAVALKAAALAALDLPDGVQADAAAGEPARGRPVAITVHWTDADGGGRLLPASRLVRDRRSDRALPAWPWVWSGSVLATYQDRAGGTVRRLAAGEDGCIIAIHDENGSSLASCPLIDPREDRRWEVNSALAPPVGTRVALVLAPCRLTRLEDARPRWRAAGADGSVCDAGLEPARRLDGGFRDALRLAADPGP
jgi:hypothetical protein